VKIISRQPDEVMGKKGKLQQKQFGNHLISYMKHLLFVIPSVA